MPHGFSDDMPLAPLNLGKGKAKTDREQNMNKKRKILTMVALAVFGAIFYFHYWSLGYDSGSREIQYLTAAEQRAYTQRGWKIEKPIPEQPSAKSQADDPSAAFRDLGKVIVERPGSGYYLDNREPAIKDVRMPIFGLAV